MIWNVLCEAPNASVFSCSGPLISNSGKEIVLLHEKKKYISNTFAVVCIDNDVLVSQILSEIFSI